MAAFGRVSRSAAARGRDRNSAEFHVVLFRMLHDIGKFRNLESKTAFLAISPPAKVLSRRLLFPFKASHQSAKTETFEIRQGRHDVDCSGFKGI